LVPQGLLELRVLQGLTPPYRDPLVLQERKAQLELRGFKEFKAYRESRGSLVLRALLVILDLKDCKALLVLLVQILLFRDPLV
jgi:hypothetical protein